MSSMRKTVLVAGIFYLLTEVTAIGGMLSYGSILNDPMFIVSASGGDNGVLIGAFLEVLLAVAVVGTAVTLYPVVKAYGGGVALGYVAGRLIEAVIILVGVMSLLTIVTLRHSGAVDSGATVIVGRSLVALHGWTFLFGPKLALGVNTVLLASLMFRSRLVPRPIAVLGLVGGSLVFISGTAVLFGAYADMSTLGFAAAMPVLAWELSVALWMITKGFRTFTRAPLSTPVALERSFS